MNVSDKLLEVKEVRKVFGEGSNGTMALNSVTLDVLPGEFLGIMGASGSGKTTLLNVIATMLKPTSGQILLDGQNISSFKGSQLASYRGDQIGYLFQQFELIDNLTAKENIMLPLAIHGVNLKEQEHELLQLAKIFDIEELLNQFPSQLSGGQKQRVASARALILIVGVCGTFILFRGLGSMIGVYVKRKGSSSTGLSMFTARQLQENVLHQWSSLSVSSLLILMAMVCFAFGTSTALTNSSVANRTVDYTFNGNEEEIIPWIKSDELAPYVDRYYGMALHSFYTPEDEPVLNDHFAWAGLLETVSGQADSEPKEILLNNLSMQDTPYFISLSSYNAMLEAAGKKPIQLADDEVAMYTSDDTGAPYDILKGTLKKSPTVQIAENEYTLLPKLYSDQIVADRAITLMYSLIVPDALFNQYFDAEETSLWNMTLKDEFIEEKGLMQAMLEVDQVLDSTGLPYESYLGSMGRQLFYTVAGNYTTFYLGVMFLIIANSVLGLNFLMQQRNTRSRYQTLAMLGADVESICTSARKQIWLYFILAISVACVSGIFGIWSLSTAMPGTVVSLQSGIVIGLVVLLFIVIEVGYIRMIQRKSDGEIRKLKEME